MEMVKSNHQYIGTFSVVSGSLKFGDPCYHNTNPYMLCRAKARKGVWIVKAIYGDPNDCGDKIVVSLQAHHINFDSAKKYRQDADSFPVDSGNAGIFDKDSIGDDTIQFDPDERYPTDPDDEWYSRVVATLHSSDFDVGVLQHGTLAGTTRDGFYSAIILYNARDEAELIELSFVAPSKYKEK